MRPAQLVIAASAAILAVAGMKTALSESPEPPAGERTRPRVVVTSVVDGDTLRGRARGGRDLGRIRILGIDAPEVAHPPDPAECYADTATDTLSAFAPVGSTIVLVSDPTQADRDSYGRLLRYVDHDRDDVGLELLVAGAARLYDSDPSIERNQAYERAVELPRDHGRGLWGHC